MTRLMKRYLGYLVPARSIVDVPISHVNYRDGHQLPDVDLFFIAQTKQFIRNAELIIPTQRKFFQRVMSAILIISYDAYILVSTELSLLSF